MENQEQFAKTAILYVKNVFSENATLSIPIFQRPYLWQTGQIQGLLDNLLMPTEGSNVEQDKSSPHFLGSVVFTRMNDSEVFLVDGQQRLITLTILLAILRSLLPLEYTPSIVRCLYKDEPNNGDKIRHYHLRLREYDELFFRHYIQDEDGINKLRSLDQTELLSDSQKNIYKNTLYLLQFLENQPLEILISLLNTVLHRCYMVAISISNLENTFQVFTRLNATGTQLSEADLLKARLLSATPKDTQVLSAKKWEDVERRLGHSKLNDLISDIKHIHRHIEHQKDIVQNFLDNLRPTIQPLQFIDKILLPSAEAFLILKNANYRGREKSEEINVHLYWMNRFKNSDWVPAAILYLTRNYENEAALLRFFSNLERLATSLMLRKASRERIVERYSKLLEWVENGDDLYLPNSPLQLTQREKDEVITILNGDLYLQEYCSHVLLRLDMALSEGEAVYKHSIISIEHVLPQNPALNSIWLQWFPNQAEREKSVHRLSNLVLLSRRKNSQAQNYDFEVKKQRYFATQKGVSPFALTSQVLNEQEWTPMLLGRRQKELLVVLKNLWCL